MIKVIKVMPKGAYEWVLISLSLAVEPVGRLTTVSVMHGQCDSRPMVTFPACAGIKFILLGDSWLRRILIL